MIELSRVIKGFGRKPVLRGLDFTALDGRVTGFVGANGAGKSTALKILAGTLSADGGDARIDGEPYWKSTAPEKCAGFFLGADRLPGGMTGEGYLCYASALRALKSPAVDHYLEMVGLEKAAHRRIADYSLGMRQRLGLAVALLGDPQNVILDEPINGLDVEGVHWTRELLRALAAEGRCVLLSSHVLSELELVADDIVILAEGRAVVQGPLETLRRGDRGHVHVRTPDPARLIEALRVAGLTATSVNRGVDVVGIEVTPLLKILAGTGLEIESVAPATRAIEDLFLEEASQYQEVRA